MVVKWLIDMGGSYVKTDEYIILIQNTCHVHVDEFNFRLPCVKFSNILCRLYNWIKLNWSTGGYYFTTNIANIIIKNNMYLLKWAIQIDEKYNKNCSRQYICLFKKLKKIQTLNRCGVDLGTDKDVSLSSNGTSNLIWYPTLASFVKKKWCIAKSWRQSILVCVASRV